MLLKEKNASFIEDVNVRLEGNVAIVPRPGGDIEEDGSLEISGTLYTDLFRSATNNTQIIIGDPFHIQEKATPNNPPQGKIVLYSDDQSDSRLYMLNYLGQRIDLNPLKVPGDLMTYDSILDTTVRVPTGTFDQVLSLDAGNNVGNLGNNLRWKIMNGYSTVLATESSDYMKYLVMENTNVIETGLTVNYMNFNFNTVKRKDSAYTILTPGVFQITETGNYNINVKISVGQGFINPEYTDTSNFVIVLQEDSAGFVDIPGSKVYGIIRGGSESTIVCQAIGFYPSGTQIRVRIKEINSVTNSLKIRPNSSSINVQKIVVDSTATDTTELVSVYGTNTVVLSGSNTVINMNNILIKTNGSDSLTSNEIVYDNAGYRHVFGKVVLSSTNLPADEKARVRVVLLHNDIEVNSSISEVTLNSTSDGTLMSISCYVSSIINIGASDTISIAARIISQSVAAQIIIKSNESMLSSILYSSNSVPNPNIWEKMNIRLNALQIITPLNFNDIEFNTTEILDTNYVYNNVLKVISIKKHGTYTLNLSCTIENTSSSELTTGIRLLIDSSGTGFKEYRGSRSLINISSNQSQTLVLNELLHIPSNSLLKFQILGGRDTMNLIANGTNLLLYRLEDTISISSGSNLFGSSYHHIFSDVEIITTSITNIVITTLTTGTIPTGEYRISWQYDYNMSSGGKKMYTNLYIDGVNIDSISEKPSSTETFMKKNNYIKRSIVGGIHTLEIKARTEDSSKALHLQNYGIELFRIE